MSRLFISLFLLCSFWCAGALADASLTPDYRGPLAGFYSFDPPHALSREHGNPGRNLGAQRRWAFEQALEFWGRRLDSNVEIKIIAEMKDLSCDEYGAVLGSAGPESVFRDWPAGSGSTPPFANTWYVPALANRIANRDLSVISYDISSSFNKLIDENDGCLGSYTWYYALGEAPPGTISFFTTVLHEIGHGLGFVTFVDLTNGSRLSGYDDAYMQFLEDHSTGKLWPDMNDLERVASVTDTSDLHWVGPNVLAALGSLSDGVSGGHVQLYAPNVLEGGSSVSHWDVNLSDNNNNDEVMEPNATGSDKLTVTDELLHDIGWNNVAANNCEFASDRLLVSSLLSGTNTRNACVSVTYDGATITDGNTSTTAGRSVVLKNEFSVEQGATFGVRVDPNIGL